MITLILILIILTSSMSLNNNAVSAQWLTRLSSIAIIFSSLLIINIFYINRLEDGLSIFSGFLNLNSINQIFQILLLIIGGIITASIINFTYFLNSSMVSNYILEQKYLINYTLIILFNLIGASCLIIAGDLLTLYIAVEIQSFSLYILCTLKNDSSKSASAGLKYFLIGSLASIFILLGIALFYYATGLTNFENIFIYYSITDWFGFDGFTAGLFKPNSPYYHTIGVWNFTQMNPFYFLSIFSIILIIIGILIKVGAAPFHQWTIDVYSLVPTTVTTWLVILPKIALFILLFQILGLVLETGNAILYSSANNSIIDWMVDKSVINYINQLITNNSINFYYVTNWLNNFYYDQLINNIKNVYGDVINFYPHYLQIELLNAINSPIINENDYNFVLMSQSDNKDLINNIWNDYSSDLYNSLYYTFIIIPSGSIIIKNLLILISIISLIIGAIGGLYQLNIKRLLAFSAINQVGFLIIALTISNKVSLNSFIFYFVQYSLINLNVFLVLVTLGNIVYHYPLITLSILEKNNKYLINKTKTLGYDINYINQLKGIFEINPILALSLIISLFSFIGIPPLPGFFAKQQVFLSAISLGFIFISILAILTSVVTASYYLNLIKNTILKDTIIKKTDLIKKYFLGSFFNKSYIINVQPINYNKLGLGFSIINSYTISLLTLSILLFIFKSEIIFNIINNITFCWFQL